MVINIQISDFEHPFISPPKRYHINKNIISSITTEKLIHIKSNLLSIND
jgi:hypothetical protein